MDNIITSTNTTETRVSLFSFEKSKLTRLSQISLHHNSSAEQPDRVQPTGFEVWTTNTTQTIIQCSLKALTLPNYMHKSHTSRHLLHYFAGVSPLTMATLHIRIMSLSVSINSLAAFPMNYHHTECLHQLVPNAHLRMPLKSQRNTGGDMSIFSITHLPPPKKFTCPEQQQIKGLNFETIATVYFPHHLDSTTPNMQASNPNQMTTIMISTPHFLVSTYSVQLEQYVLLPVWPICIHIFSYMGDPARQRRQITRYETHDPTAYCPRALLSAVSLSPYLNNITTTT
jgi:hypothetical protein